MTKKVKRDKSYTFRIPGANLEYLQEIADDNDMDLSDVMNIIVEYYIESGDVIKIVKEIKRKDKKNNGR